MLTTSVSVMVITLVEKTIPLVVELATSGVELDTPVDNGMPVDRGTSVDHGMPVPEEDVPLAEELGMGYGG